jgi:tetratricopeptide (TPR) repeat protein
LRSITQILLTSLLTFSSFCLPAQQKTTYTNFNRGEYFFYYQKWDSAYLMFEQYLGETNNPLAKAKSYSYMGEIQQIMGDIYGAQETLMKGIRILDAAKEQHREALAIMYNILGNISLELKRYDEAISMFDKGFALLPVKSDYGVEMVNSKAIALQRKGDYDRAVRIYDSLLQLQPTNQLLAARIMHNRARTKWLQNHAYNPTPYFHRSLKIRLDSSFLPGLNASYAHLADYYEKPNPDSAIWYATKMYTTAKQNQSADDVLEAIDKLIRFNKSAPEKEQWYAAFKRLNDSVQLSRDTTRNRFALIRYEVQKNKADNLSLQQHITKQRLLIFGVSILSIGLLAGLWFWFRYRRRKLKQEAEITIRDARLNTSQKVHDVVANGLYGIMNLLEHSEEIERGPLLTKVEDLYEKSRDISHEEVGFADDLDYDKQIHRLLNEFTNDQTSVFVVGNQPVFWNKVSGVQKNQLLLILREIMTNMKKHSGAGNVVIKFKEEKNTGTISYNDDGKGFPSNIQYGNGLNNTVNRIKSLNGDIIFGKSDKGGASIAISFALQSSKV